MRLEEKLKRKQEAKEKLKGEVLIFKIKRKSVKSFTGKIYMRGEDVSELVATLMDGKKVNGDGVRIKYPHLQAQLYNLQIVFLEE